MSIVFRSAAFLLCFSFLFTVTFACTCLDYSVPVCKLYKDADAVFVGKIERITSAAGDKDTSVPMGRVASISSFKSGLVFVHFKVERAFKGVDGPVVKAITYRGTSCDLEIKAGKRWVVYAHKDPDTGYLGFGACGGNGEISKDSPEIKELEDLLGGKGGLSVTGRVAQDTHFGVVKAAVSLTADGVNLTTQTDSEGRYSFAVPAPGIYKVRISVPFSAINVRQGNNQKKVTELPTETETIFEYEARVENGNCDYVLIDAYKIDLKATASITGKFIHKDWPFFPRLFPQVCRLKETEKETLGSCRPYVSLKMDGSFAADTLREGRYTIVVGDDIPDSSSPILRHYYPGVKNFSEARPIILEQGQKLEGLEFNLPPIIPIRHIKGQVFDKDGKELAAGPAMKRKPHISVYYMTEPPKFLFLHDFTVDWGEGVDTKIVRMIDVNPDGTFSLYLYKGYRYFVTAEVEDQNGKKRCGFADVDLQTDQDIDKPSKLLIDRSDGCDLADYYKNKKDENVARA